MPGNCRAIGDKEVEEILGVLMNDYGMGIECLSNLFEVKNDGHKIEIPTGSAERYCLR